MTSNEPTREDDNETFPGQTERSRPPTPQSPSFYEITRQLEVLQPAPAAHTFDAENLPLEFGNYTLNEVVGAGGAGIVFRATPKPDHAAAKGFEVVAVKLIRPEIMANQKAAKRFEKESRVHAEIDSEYVTRHLEFGCERGVHFIASEFVDGECLSDVIDQSKGFLVKQTLRIVADILKALDALHRKGVIHRDVKPGNVIAIFGSRANSQEASYEDFVVAKLTDFGLARHVEQSESLAMTRQQTMLGTPLYMAPEQYFESRTADARADIYSVGVTLYKMLAGKLPFHSEEIVELAEMHRVERPRPLTLVREGIGEAVNNIVMKALEKEPVLRYQNASEMLADVERVLNDQPTSIRLYPETPSSSHRAVRCYDFEWDLDATAKQLWPLVADTDRFNQAIGLPAPNFTYEHSDSQRKIFAQANFNGMNVRWREHPFQWILEREMSVLREFEAGPFEWVSSTVTLDPLAGGRTRLVHSFQVKPRGIFGKLMTPIQFNVMTKRSLNKVYSKLESIANDSSCAFACDVPFSKPVKLSAAQQQILNERSERLATAISNRPLTKEFAGLITSVADPFAARIRPIPLSQKLECSLESSIDLCLRGVEFGLLNMSWDVICPICRIAAGNNSSLSRFDRHAHCKVCNLDFEVDFSKSVEVIFSVHPEIRPIELKTYCIGGPFHAPHVLAQNRLMANQCVDVGTSLTAGKYQICGPQLVEQPNVTVLEDALASRGEFYVGTKSPPIPDLKLGTVCIHIENQSKVEVLVRFEQATGSEDSMTAAMANQLPLFQKLFPDEKVEPEKLIDLSNAYLLGIKLLQADDLIAQLGEIQFREQMSKLQQQFQSDVVGSKVVERTHDSMIVSFGLLQSLIDSLNSIILSNPSSSLPVQAFCFAINSGEIMMDSQANQPAAFGKTVRRTRQILSEASDCSIVLPVDVFEQLTADCKQIPEQPFGKFKSVDRGDKSGFIKLIAE
jgi:serine/threonine protein kinase